MSAVVEHSFENLGRRFVHRNDTAATERYASVAEMCTDVDILRSDLARLGLNAEYWLRLLNDLVCCLEDWPLPSAQIPVAIVALNKFDEPVLALTPRLSQTQKTRFNSIALRACQVTAAPVLTGVISQFGDTLQL